MHWKHFKPALVMASFVCIAATNDLAAAPDLIVNRRLLARSVEVQLRTFAAGECAVVEGCTVPGERKLLLFDAAIANIGLSNLVIGDPSARTNLFHFSECHQHYHMNGFSSYTLLNSSGAAVRRSRKQGFCLRDDRPYFADARPARGFNCENQGITKGWQDVYDKSLDCQFLDITGLKPGRYQLRVTVNPKRLLRESNYGNNSVTVPVTIR